MTCENLQFNLSIYLDDVLTEEERNVVDGHLAACPLCRQKLSDFQGIQRLLRTKRRPELSGDALFSLRNKVAAQLALKPANSGLSEKFNSWARTFLMPYAVGTAATLLFGFLILWALITANTGNSKNSAFVEYDTVETSRILLAKSTSNAGNNFALDPVDFANERLSISAESPSVNPQGALVALTRSFVRGEMKDDEVVVVADVFGNGLARIAEVVEPSKDRHAVHELEKALKTNPDYAPPFVPANMDNRSDTVRVVLKFQTVNVDTKKSSN
jgi:hypothetical protein